MTKVETKEKEKQKKQLDEEVASIKHFVPSPLVFIILFCSGFLAVLSYRDVFSTGKVIFGPRDEAMLRFTKSMQWFTDEKGWKSTQGGFSAIKNETTDGNDMGGFFIRKTAGIMGLTFHLQKLVPVVFQKSDTHWGKDHFNPVLLSSALCNLALAGYYTSNMEDLKDNGAHEMGFAIIAVLLIESFVILGYAISSAVNRMKSTTSKVKLPLGKTPNSVVSRIVARTVAMVSGMVAVIAARDFFYPGEELPFPPYDDIYLEWTGAFIHSPPALSEESIKYGLEAPLHIGEKFISRLMALYALIICFQKLVASFLVRLGIDNSGIIKVKMFRRCQAVGNA